MGEIDNLISPFLIEGVRLWTGWGTSRLPTRDDASIVRRFGDDIACRLLPAIKSLEHDFYLSDARFRAANIQEMAKLASAQFKQRYPSIADEVATVFAWCYTFDFK